MHSIAAGVIAQDCNGFVLFSVGCLFHGHSDVAVAETLAIRFALTLAKEKNLQHLVCVLEC